MQSIAMANPLIFSGKIDCTLLEDRTDAATTSVMKSLNLRIEERSLDNGETEVRIELGNPDDLELLYAEGITARKYKELSNNWNVESSFEDCFRIVLAPILKEARQTVQYKCSLSQNGTVCLFEIVAKRDFILLRIPIKLYRVTGDSLIKHLAANLRKYQKKTAKLARSLEESSSSRPALEDELYKLKEEHAILLTAHTEMTKQVERLERARMEAENDAELNEDAAEDGIEKIAKLEDDIEGFKQYIDEVNRFWIDDVDKYKAEASQLQCEIDALARENSTLKGKVASLTGDFSKAKDVIRKYVDLERETVSVDGQMWQEMEDALREKDEAIRFMKDTVNNYKMKMEGKHAEIEKLKNDLSSKDIAIVNLEQKLNLYRLPNSPLSNINMAQRLAAMSSRETTPKQNFRPLTNITPSTVNLPPNVVSSPKPSFKQSRVPTPTFDALKIRK